jgi:dihydrofolate synthase/folylpolyglutamate synthase
MSNKKKLRGESNLIPLRGLGVESYKNTIQYLYDRLPVFHQIGGAAYKPGLENTNRLMNALDNPQSKFRSIHVAGTNGKGSVSHFLAAILQKAGYKVGLYTSPHLVDFRERIRVNGEMIDQQYVVNFVESQKKLFNEIEPSFFEATMAMAFNYFANSEVDVAVIEVGLGGRLDSTNIIVPELSIITNISFDHVGFLGDTLEKIAFEKAGIIKHNVPVIIGETLPETKPVFQAKAIAENAPIYLAETQQKVSFNSYSDNKMIVQTSDNKSFTVGLCGIYQLKNIATTLTAVEQLNQLNFKISETAIRSGFKNVSEITGLQGRWQIIQQNPTIVFDTGHNTAGIQYVVEQLKRQKYNKLRIIFGMVNDKDCSAVLKLLPKDAEYYFTQARIERALPAALLQQNAESTSLNGNVYLSVKQALESAIIQSEKEDFIFVGGSNFVVGEALEYFQKN